MAIKQRPDLVLLDISMPTGDGFVVAARIQTLVSAMTPIISSLPARSPACAGRRTSWALPAFF
jgi:CheY-like chemotaxis protein